ncbi:MAG: NADH-quinone oxidoreductase subunit M [Planctomycetota bacterium]
MQHPAPPKPAAQSAWVAAVAFFASLGLLAAPIEITRLLAMMGIPIVFAAFMIFRPASNARWWALSATSANLLLSLKLMADFFASPPAGGGFSMIFAREIVPEIGFSFSLGLDAVSVLLIALTALLGPVCVLGSWNAIRRRQRLFYGWLLLLQTAMYGVFAARDLLVFYISFEFTLLPLFVLINEFGSSDRRRAAVKFFLYTFTGSIIALVGLLFVAFHAASRPEIGVFTLDIGLLAEAARTMPASAQALVMLAMLAGFAVKVPLFPVHTWLPLAHTEAPTAGSVILAGVLLKLGTYAIYRFVLPFTPEAAFDYAPYIAVLSIIGIVYAGLVCWVQNDVKKLVAYSSVSHLGFCVLGLFAMNSIGLTGSVLYMINHGLSTGALFLLIGFMYERYHTRDLRQLGGLASKMPVWSFFMVFFVMASVGLPGLNGFVSEFMTMMGTFQSDSALVDSQPGATFGPLGPWYAFAAATGVIVAAIYLLTMLAKIVWGPLREPPGHADGHAEDDGAAGALPRDVTTAHELIPLTALAALCLLFGLYPKPLIVALEPPINAQVASIRSAIELSVPNVPDGVERQVVGPVNGEAAPAASGRVGESE